MKQFLAVITALSALIIFSQSKFTVSPPRYELTCNQGELKTITINVENHGDSTLHVKIYPADWNLDYKNEVSFFPSNTLKNSCSGWFYINPQEFNIKPFSSEEVRVTLNVPKEVYGDYWSMLFFESTPFASGATPMIMLNSRVGCTIYSTIAGTVTKNGDLVGLDFDKKEYGVNAVFENSGNVHLRIKGFLQIFSDNKMIYEKSISDQLSLPDTKTNLYFPVETELKKGEYLLKVNLDYSGSELLEGEKRIQID